MSTQEKISTNVLTSDNGDRLSRIESMLEQITNQMNQAPSLISIATDAIDEKIRQSRATGVDFEERLQNAADLLVRLTDPQLYQTLSGFLDFAEQAPGLIAMTADMADEAIIKANEGIPINDRLSAGLSLVTKLTEPDMAEKIKNLIELSDQLPGLIAMTVDSMDEAMRDNKLLDPANLRFVKSLSEAHTESLTDPPKIGGIFGMLRALKDPDRQKALGYLMNVLKNLGKKL